MLLFKRSYLVNYVLMIDDTCGYVIAGSASIEVCVRAADAISSAMVHLFDTDTKATLQWWWRYYFLNKAPVVRRRRTLREDFEGISKNFVTNTTTYKQLQNDDDEQNLLYVLPCTTSNKI